MIGQPYCSTALHLGQEVDSRYLTVALEFFDLNQYEARALVLELISWVNDISSGGFTASWRLNRKPVSFKQMIAKLQSTELNLSNSLSILTEAYARTSIVKNVSDLRNIRSQMTRQIGTLDSMNFISYWNSLFPYGRCTDDEVRCRIIQLFNENAYYQITKNCLFDLQGLLHVTPYSGNSQLYFGSFSLSISSFFLQEDVVDVSRQFTNFLKCVNESYKKVNGRVMLQPFTLGYGRSPYMDYFGDHCNADGSHLVAGILEKEWYPTYYMCGVEWANVISSRVRAHLLDLCDTSESPENIVCTSLEGGGLFIGSNVDIRQYNTSHAKQLKSLVSNALYPGSRKFIISDMFDKSGGAYLWGALPRYDWAIVPVFDDEIELNGSSIILFADNS